MSIFDYLRDLFERPAVYRKFWVGLASAVLTMLTIHYSDNTALQALIPFLGSLGVYAAPNDRPVL